MKTNQAFRGTSCRISLSIATGAIALFAAAISLPATAAGTGGGSGGGSGGHTEPVGNNLSFPVIWGDGSLSLPGYMNQASLEVPWSTTVDYDGKKHYAYAQKTSGNVWQAENKVWDPVANGQLFVDDIDWGDSLESVDMKVGRPVRIELSLYRFTAPGQPMTGFVMAMLANPSSPDEVQGVIAPSSGSRDNPVSNAVRWPFPEATVYSANGQLVVQKLTGLREAVQPDDLKWEDNQWKDADTGDLISIGAPQSLSFTAELNVGGKVIYGLSQGGWRPTSAGDYRVTFYLPIPAIPELPKVAFDASTTVRESVGTEVAAAAEGDEAGGTAVVVPDKNLTYIDIRVAGGGGGGGRPKKATSK